MGEEGRDMGERVGGKRGGKGKAGIWGIGVRKGWAEGGEGRVRQGYVGLG